MCYRPPCENCEADYDACFDKCPKCGHPNDQGLPLLQTADLDPVPKFEVKIEKHYCKICMTYHEVTHYLTVEA